MQQGEFRGQNPGIHRALLAVRYHFFFFFYRYYIFSPASRAPGWMGGGWQQLVRRAADVNTDRRWFTFRRRLLSSPPPPPPPTPALPRYRPVRFLVSIATRLSFLQLLAKGKELAVGSYRRTVIDLIVGKSHFVKAPRTPPPPSRLPPSSPHPRPSTFFPVPSSWVTSRLPALL